jgi:hypothetical protein
MKRGKKKENLNANFTQQMGIFFCSSRRSPSYKHKVQSKRDIERNTKED